MVNTSFERLQHIIIKYNIPHSALERDRLSFPSRHYTKRGSSFLSLTSILIEFNGFIWKLNFILLMPLSGWNNRGHIILSTPITKLQDPFLAGKLLADIPKYTWFITRYLKDYYPISPPQENREICQEVTYQLHNLRYNIRFTFLSEGDWKGLKRKGPNLSAFTSFLFYFIYRTLVLLWSDERLIPNPSLYALRTSGESPLGHHFYWVGWESLIGKHKWIFFLLKHALSGRLSMINGMHLHPSKSH